MNSLLTEYNKSTRPSDNQIKDLLSLYSNGNFTKALSLIDKMLIQFPRSVTLYNLEGACFAGLNLFDQAIKSYKQAIEIKPNFAEAYNNMGVAQTE